MLAFLDDTSVYFGILAVLALVIWFPLRRKWPPQQPRQSSTPSLLRVLDWGPSPPAAPRRGPHVTADGRNRWDMSGDEYHADVRHRDPNKANTDYPPTYRAYREFYRGEWPRIRAQFKLEIESYDPMLWRCWADRTGRTCWGKITVDHIHPVELFWSRRARMGNYQCLCARHDEQKGNSQPLDYRPSWLRERYPD